VGSTAATTVDPIDEARGYWVAAGWSSTALAMANITTIMRVQQILLAQINATLRPHQITFARLEVLMVLLASRRGGLPVGKISARLQVYPGAVTNVVDRLEADGLVRRAPHPTDGRGIIATITPRGRKLALRSIDDLNAMVLEQFEPSGAAGEQLFGLLREIRAAAGDLEGPGSEPATRGTGAMEG
jgi:DNA-binding MarR family transcriptional regulator